jgi:hypothetical protein
MILQELLVVGQGWLLSQLFGDFAVGVQESIETGNITATIVIVVAAGILGWRRLCTYISRET